MYTERLDIIPWKTEDAEAFYALSLDEGFTLFPITDYRQTSVESSRKWIETHPEKFAVWVRGSKELIGMGGLTPWLWNGEELIDITYRLRSSAHGKGYGWELAKALVDYGLNDLKLTQITATITPDNGPSKKIAERLGFKFDKRIELLGIATDLFRLSV
jgi:RimJ/RimL family protein N-acetyltransferase